MSVEILEKLVKERRSVRQWQKKEVPDELIRKGIELAAWAPNGGNYQGWRFVAVKNPATITAMADAVQAAGDRIASWPESDGWREDMERFRKNSSFFRNAPVVIAPFISQYKSVMDRTLLAREAFDAEAKEMLAMRRFAPTAIQSASAAVTTLLLTFHAMGLGAVWLGAPLMGKKKIEAILKVPSELELTCLVAAGYPAETPQKTRKQVDEVLEFVR
jgi:nitroreductase